MSEDPLFEQANSNSDDVENKHLTRQYNAYHPNYISMGLWKERKPEQEREGFDRIHKLLKRMQLTFPRQRPTTDELILELKAFI